ncbi:acetylglutamate kinase, partial [Myxococcota bacterium]|nr:acetylglutamate kinase [Myxococcota bacterium]
MPEFKETRSLIVKLLRNLGSKKEVEQYLKEFSTVEARKFAVVKVGGGVVRDDLDALASALSFLQRVGLYPIVIHGAGPQLNAALEAQGLASKWEAGFRVTDPETLQVARKVFQRVNLDLVNALEDLGTRATPIISGVFEAELLDEARYGLVGDITRLHLESIHASIERGALPILASLGETPDGQIVNINADVAANQLAEGVEPYKIVFLTPTGGIYDDKERVIPSINLSEDFDHLMSQPWLHSGMRVKLQEVHDLLMKLPYSSSVSITQPSQ